MAVSGIHHVKIPVSDLAAGIEWYCTVFDGATRLDAFDHRDTDGVTFASLLTIPGVDVPIELRWAPIAAYAWRRCDVMILSVLEDDLPAWVDHLDACGADHSPLLTGPGGSVLVVEDPDGKYIRLVAPPEGPSNGDLRTRRLDPRGPWLDPTPMQHPRITYRQDESTQGAPS